VLMPVCSCLTGINFFLQYRCVLREVDANIYRIRGEGVFMTLKRPLIEL
jgi:hypothetical protein